MGLFEHCETMLEGRLIDFRTFKSIFAYRLSNIVANRVIVEVKLVREREHWTRFLSLLKRNGIEVGT